MVWHLPVVAVVSGAAGLLASAKAISDGKSTEEVIKSGLAMTGNVAMLTGTFGLIFHDAGFDISSSDICYDGDHSCVGKKS